MDFTLRIYKQLLKALFTQGYSCITYAEFIQKSTDKLIILRHDVDANPNNSLRFAQIQAVYGISGTYFFRVVPQSYDEKIIKEIASLGHEIGYHYEDFSQAKGNNKKAIELFEANLNL